MRKAPTKNCEKAQAMALKGMSVRLFSNTRGLTTPGHLFGFKLSLAGAASFWLLICPPSGLGSFAYLTLPLGMPAATLMRVGTITRWVGAELARGHAAGGGAKASASTQRPPDHAVGCPSISPSSAFPFWETALLLMESLFYRVSLPLVW